MKKNVASQVASVQMTTAADGSNFTGTVTVYITGDGGTQTIGSVGSGVCTHEGKGLHSYLPAQAETNYNHIAFTYEGTGAITATVQVYTSFPQTGDAYAETQNGTYGLSALETLVDDLETRIGTPSNLGSGATVAANLVDIEGQTDDIGTAGAGLTAVPWNAAWDAEVQSEVADALAVYDPPTKAELDSAVAPLALEATAQSILTDTAEIGAAGAGLTNINLPNQTMDIVGNITGNLSGSVGSVTGAVGSVTGSVGGNVTGSVGSLATQAKADVNAEVLDVLNVDTFAEPGQEAPASTNTLAKKLGYLFKFLRNKIEQTSTTLSVYDDAGTTVDQKATVSDDGTTYTRGEIVSGP